MKLTDDEIIDLYKELDAYIDEYLEEKQARKVFALMKKYEDQILTAPASTRTTYHGAYPGGWLVHVLNVIRFALETHGVWETMGLDIDFTKEDIVLVSALSFFGKLGLDEEPYYIMHPQFSTRFKARTKKVKAYWETILYTVNENLPYMKVPELTLHILQKEGIELSLDQHLAIKLSEGIFDESNKVYFANSFSSKPTPKLVMLLVMANWMSITFEKEEETDGKKDEALKKLMGAL